MIIGAIETCTAHEIGGWLHSHNADLTGQTVLAYLDGVCVGAGEVGLFRKDLMEAGLGNGKRGFHFGISIPEPVDANRVVVSLTNCQAIILPPGATVAATATEAGPSAFLCGALPDAGRLRWLRERRVLADTEADFIQALGTYGVAVDPIDPEDPAARIRAIFEAIHLGPLEIACIELTSDQDVPRALADHEGAADAGLFALVSDRRMTFLVQETEGGHPGRRMHDDVVGGVEHVCDRRSGLFIRRWTPFTLKRVLKTEAIRCYFPVPKANAELGTDADIQE